LVKFHGNSLSPSENRPIAKSFTGYFLTHPVVCFVDTPSCSCQLTIIVDGLSC